MAPTPFHTPLRIRYGETDQMGVVHHASFLGYLEDARTFFMQKLGYRWATSEELTKAREAATPGSVNKWFPVNRLIPRGLPYLVNEYGFDTANNTSSNYFTTSTSSSYLNRIKHGSRAWWVVKE